MARGRGNRKGADSAADDPGVAEPESEPGSSLNPIPELMRKALSVGFSGFFMTETAIRRALGDTLPRDWVDFAVEQSQRTRAELIERLSFEVGRALENIDAARVLSELLEGRTLEIKAEIRLGEPAAEPARRKVEISARGRERPRS